MIELPQVVIVMARCSRKKEPYGIRFEEKERGHWVADWAFPIKLALAHKEGYDRNILEGSFSFDNSYPGCPGCGASSLVVCSCGKAGCWDGDAHRWTCPWCGQIGEIQGPATRLEVGSDR